MINKSSKLFDEIHLMVRKPFVTNRFGDGWKDFAEETLTKYDLIDIAWTQGRTVVLLEREIEKLLDN